MPGGTQCRCGGHLAQGLVQEAAVDESDWDLKSSSQLRRRLAVAVGKGTAAAAAAAVDVIAG